VTNLTELFLTSSLTLAHVHPIFVKTSVMQTQNIILKGLIIFGVIGFILFLCLIIIGIILNAFGLSCQCYTVFAWSLIGVAGLAGLISWLGCCSNK
jgi:hypothetical protein